MPRNDIQLDTRVLDAIIRNSDGNVGTAIAKIAFSVEGRGKVKIQQMDAIDTGALLNSMATSIHGGGSESAAQAAALGRNPGATISDLPVPNDSHTAYVGPTVEYATDVHFGTHSMPGRPFLLEAVRETERDFRDMLGEAVVNGR